jgi:hypothetical protein
MVRSSSRVTRLARVMAPKLKGNAISRSIAAHSSVTRAAFTVSASS